MPVQSVAAVHGAAMYSCAVYWRGSPYSIECAADLLQNAFRGNIRTVQIHRKVVKTNLFETLKNDIQSGALLGDKEDPLAGRRHAGDQINDGLALTRARRAVNYAIFTLEHSVHGTLLTGVGIQHEKLVVGRCAVQFFRVDLAVARSSRAPSFDVSCDGRDQVVRHQFRAAFLQVLHHSHLLKREIAKISVRPDREILHVFAALLEVAEEMLRIKWFRFIPAVQ